MSEEQTISSKDDKKAPTIKELKINLDTWGIGFIGFHTLSMTSNRYLCVRHTIDGVEYVSVISIDDNDLILKKQLKAESTIMHPERQILGIRLGAILQIFSIEEKNRIKGCQLKDPVLYWTWISENLIGIVSESQIHHWNFDKDDFPKSFFSKHKAMEGKQITSYKVSDNLLWAIVTGISVGNGKVNGLIQLYSNEKGASQLIEGHAGDFGSFFQEGKTTETNIFAFTGASPNGGFIEIVEIDNKGDSPNLDKIKRGFMFLSDKGKDFPVSLQILGKYGLIFVITKHGFLHVFSIEDGVELFTDKISEDTVFLSTKNGQDGINIANRKGGIISIKLDNERIAEYIRTETPNGEERAIRMSITASLQGTDALYRSGFKKLISNEKYVEAARLAAKSPKGTLRTKETISVLRGKKNASGTISPLHIYFSTLLEGDRLNEVESIELVRPTLAQNKVSLVYKWLEDGKLSCTKELGDYVRQHDVLLAEKLYEVAGFDEGVVYCLAKRKEIDKIMKYEETHGYTPGYLSILAVYLKTDTIYGCEFAEVLVRKHPEMVKNIVKVFTDTGLTQKGVEVLLNVLNEDKKSEADLQTELLRLVLKERKELGDKLLRMRTYSHYNSGEVAKACEEAEMMERAAEVYKDFVDIERVVRKVEKPFDEEWVEEILEKLDEKDFFTCLEIFSLHGDSEIQECIKNSLDIEDSRQRRISKKACSEFIEKRHDDRAVFSYLKKVVNEKSDEELVYLYIFYASKLNDIKEIEGACLSYSCKVEKVASFLKGLGKEYIPAIIILYDRNNKTKELVENLLQKDLLNEIKKYINYKNTEKTGEVILLMLKMKRSYGEVLEVLFGCKSFQIATVEMLTEKDIDGLFPFLCGLIDGNSEGKTSVALSTEIAKGYVRRAVTPESKQMAMDFLNENNYYKKRDLGEYSEKKDKEIAFICYRRAGDVNKCLSIGLQNNLFTELGEWLIEKKDTELWKPIFREEKERTSVIVEGAMLFCIKKRPNIEHVSPFILALVESKGQANTVVKLLDSLIYQKKLLQTRTLETLLITSAIRTERDVTKYVCNLQNYDENEVSTLCEDKGLYEEAILVYEKSKKDEKAVSAILERIGDRNRAIRYCKEKNTSEGWKVLADYELKKGNFVDSAKYFSNGESFSRYKEIIQGCEGLGEIDVLIEFLFKVVADGKEKGVRTILCRLLNKYKKKEEFNMAVEGLSLREAELLGTELYMSKEFEYAEKCYQKSKTPLLQAEALMCLNQVQECYEVLKETEKSDGQTNTSADSYRKLLNKSIELSRMDVAKKCAILLIKRTRRPEDVVSIFEEKNFLVEAMEVLDRTADIPESINEKAMFYARNYPDRLNDFLKEYSKLKKPNPRIKGLEELLDRKGLYGDLFMYFSLLGFFEEALNEVLRNNELLDSDKEMMQNIKECIRKTKDKKMIVEILRKAFQETPFRFEDMLEEISSLDIVEEVLQGLGEKDRGIAAAIVKDKLVSYQTTRSKYINSALLQHYIDTDDLESVFSFKKKGYIISEMDFMKRTNKIESKMEGVIVGLFKDLEEGVRMLKEGGYAREAILLAARSRTNQLPNDLLIYYADKRNNVMFFYTLYECCDLVSADLVYELAQRYNIHDLTMPYMCGVFQKLSLIK